MAHAISNVRTTVRGTVTRTLQPRREYIYSGRTERKESFQITMDGADATAVIDAAPATLGLDLDDIDVTAKLEVANGETLDVKWDRTTNKFRFYGGGPDSEALRSPANGANLTTELTACMAGVAAPTPALPVLHVTIQTA
jgi:hypothetical protein